MAPFQLRMVLYEIGSKYVSDTILFTQNGRVE